MQVFLHVDENLGCVGVCPVAAEKVRLVSCTECATKSGNGLPHSAQEGTQSGATGLSNTRSMNSAVAIGYGYPALSPQGPRCRQSDGDVKITPSTCTTTSTTASRDPSCLIEYILAQNVAKPCRRRFSLRLFRYPKQAHFFCHGGAHADRAEVLVDILEYCTWKPSTYSARRNKTIFSQQPPPT